MVQTTEHQLSPALFIGLERDFPVSERPPVDPNLVVPSMPPAPQRRRVAFIVAAIFSIALHVGSLLAFLRWRERIDFGASARASQAVSVEIVDSKVLEAMLRKQSSEPAPSMVAAAQEGSVAPSAAPTEKPVEDPEKEGIVAPSPPLAAPDAPDEKTRIVQEEAPKTAETAPLPVEGFGEKKEPERSEQTTQAKVKEEPDETERKQRAEEAQRKKRERDKEAKAETRAGGPSSRASDGNGTGGMHVSASPGALLEYAAHVQARVARNKPAGRGLHGTAVVAFAITQSGSLAYAGIAHSSGKPGIDRAALSAVQSAAPFPTPPAGATHTQLQFSISFRFE